MRQHYNIDRVANPRKFITAQYSADVYGMDTSFSMSMERFTHTKKEKEDVMCD